MGVKELDRLCTCGPDPYECVSDDEWLTHHRWRPDRPYRNAPRVGTEHSMSMLRGRLSVREASDRCSAMGYATEIEIARASVRYVTTGTLRAAGFVVVHTPSPKLASTTDPHTSIALPGNPNRDEWIIPWPQEVSALLDRCFNE